jgi:hypothetical protein
MRLVLHPKVYSDIDEIMGYYERVATPGLAEEFYTELRYDKGCRQARIFFNPGARYPEGEFAAVPLSLPVPRRWPRSPDPRRLPSPSTSIFWFQASIGYGRAGRVSPGVVGNCHQG